MNRILWTEVWLNAMPLFLDSIFIFIYEAIAVYRLVGIHGIDQYTDFWMKVRSFAYLLLIVGVVVMWLIIRWILKKTEVRKRIQNR